MNLLINVLGWAGAATLLVAYGLTSAGRLSAQGARFQVLNVTGALALTTNSAYFGAWPSVGLNAFWIVVGVVALVRPRRPTPALPSPVTHSPVTHSPAIKESPP